ncbi:hypothetical protein QBC36DRAFT_292749 [Triangularia setosa]|uniref:MYND-type domain-containing protein n=1 Tax=Triangularia setosa TaxID=2587417 RepID=A0AAN6W390_9PEZI|nr:hypothetical protein QBC36DRAFT_292749 [Podospora setosa]
MAAPRCTVFYEGLEKDSPKMIPKRYEVCHKTDSLMHCSGCSVYHYCTRDHQAQDWSAHKPTCKQICAKRKRLTPVVALYLTKFRPLQNLKGIKRLRETKPPGSPIPTREEILSILKDKYQCVGNTVDNQPVVNFCNNVGLLTEKMNDLLQ